MAPKTSECDRIRSRKSPREPQGRVLRRPREKKKIYGPGRFYREPWQSGSRRFQMRANFFGLNSDGSARRKGSYVCIETFIWGWSLKVTLRKFYVFESYCKRARGCISIYAFFKLSSLFFPTLFLVARGMLNK